MYSIHGFLFYFRALSTKSTRNIKNTVHIEAERTNTCQGQMTEEGQGHGTGQVTENIPETDTGIGIIGERNSTNELGKNNTL